jgi:hypothetical protein
MIKTYSKDNAAASIGYGTAVAQWVGVGFFHTAGKVRRPIESMAQTR